MIQYGAETLRTPNAPNIDGFVNWMDHNVDFWLTPDRSVIRLLVVDELDNIIAYTSLDLQSLISNQARIKGSFTLMLTSSVCHNAELNIGLTLSTFTFMRNTSVPEEAVQVVEPVEQVKPKRFRRVEFEIYKATDLTIEMSERIKSPYIYLKVTNGRDTKCTTMAQWANNEVIWDEKIKFLGVDPDEDVVTFNLVEDDNKGREVTATLRMAILGAKGIHEMTLPLTCDGEECGKLYVRMELLFSVVNRSILAATSGNQQEIIQ